MRIIEFAWFNENLAVSQDITGKHSKKTKRANCILRGAIENNKQ
jgi:hypothetical protein